MLSSVRHELVVFVNLLPIPLGATTLLPDLRSQISQGLWLQLPQTPGLHSRV